MLLISAYSVVDSSAQTMPLVYNVENSGVNYPVPAIPSFSQLPSITSLPDPFEWANGSGRMSSYSDWEYRRNEIGAQIQAFEIGVKPPRPDSITASYSGGVLTVNVTVNNKTLTLTSAVKLPAGTGPFPAVIGIEAPSGSLPDSIFTNRNIAEITYNHDQVTSYSSPSNADPFFQLYPNQNVTNTGQYAAWAWGVSRLIDGLELVQNVLPIDLNHIAVTGCSYAGKLALFAGAFDERIALTIAQESGGGGATSWRYSHSLPTGTVEDIDNTDYSWFAHQMQQFSGNNVSKLPEDHHELMAMVAPRALYVTANPSYVWLSNPSCYVASAAAATVYSALGISDRFGYSIIGNHNHCAVPDTELPEIAAFVDKFLLGENTANTSNISDFPDTSGNNYDTIGLSPWITWTNPTLSNDTTIFFAALAYPANGQVGLDTSITLRWNKLNAAEKYHFQLSTDQAFASNIILNDSTTTDTLETVSGLSEGKTYYWRVLVKTAAGLDLWSNVWQFITTEPLPTTPELFAAGPDPSQPGRILFTWNKVKNASQYLLQTSVDSTFANVFLSVSVTDTDRDLSGFQNGQEYYWRVQGSNVMGSGPWSNVGSFFVTPTDVKEQGGIPTAYSLSQNYPNPFNPTTSIKFALPHSAFTKVTIYDILGREVQTLVNGNLEAGYYEVNFNAANLVSGVYIYRIQSGDFTQTKKLLLLK